MAYMIGSLPVPEGKDRGQLTMAVTTATVTILKTNEDIAAAYKVGV